ncbi:MAG: isoprenylcysteine carboxylmethyltransferase family protein [Bacteroidales bacterium]|nr:isoprenylcysteine carboxylmethyltransferase family protein [Bacteroidales bacterium]MDZ4205216.1 isoprenylcysteine carboxylmethyltransferase family protein [Bacteroidales bacterium]
MNRKTLFALIVVPLLVGLLLYAFCGLGHLLGSALGIPARLGLPLAFRFTGLLALAVGFGILAWLFKHRSPFDVIVSTYITLTKSLTKVGLDEHAVRSEHLVITGPHRFVRHPLYSAVIILVAGWWLVLDYTFLLFCVGFLTVWFNLVVAPFEERELRALFGAQYEAYARATPRFLPSIRRRGNAITDK